MRTGFTLLGSLLLVALCAAPCPARADAVEDLAKVLDVIGGLPSVPISWQDVRDSRELFGCIDNAADDVAVAKCFDKFKNKPVGQKALSQAGLPSWATKLIAVYIDVREGDFWGLVQDASYAIACAAANIVFAVDVCGIAQAILETIGAAGEILSDIAGFIGDVGGEIASFLGFGGGSSGPPLWQVVFNKYLKPNIGSYAEDWLERPEKFKTEFDVTGHRADSLLCVIAPKEFAKSCAWLFAPLGSLSVFDRNFQAWFRGDTIYAIQMARAAAVTQGVAAAGKQAKEWLKFKHDWATYRTPADRLRKAYGIWGAASIRLQCTAAAQPWKLFLDEVSQPEVKPEASKALSSLTGWAFESTTSFCQAYEAALKAEKLKSCKVVGTPSGTALKLDCEPGASLTTCKSDSKLAASEKFPPALDLECTTHALKLPKNETLVPKVPVKIPSPPVQPKELPKDVPK